MDFQERVPLERKKGTGKMKLAYLEHERAPDPMPMPPWIGQLKDKVFQTALHFARKAYRDSGQLFYIPNAYLEPGLPWDEVTTAHIFSPLLQRLTIEELPDYSLENHRKAIDWWLARDGLLVAEALLSSDLAVCRTWLCDRWEKLGVRFHWQVLANRYTDPALAGLKALLRRAPKRIIMAKTVPDEPLCYRFGCSFAYQIK